MKRFPELNLKIKGARIKPSDIEGQILTVEYVTGLLEKANGVILADEVGLGKTYEALGVLAYYFCKKRAKRVLILTSSQTMSGEWEGRYSALFKANSETLQQRLPNPENEVSLARSFRDFRDTVKSSSKIIIASLDTIKANRDKDCRAQILSSLLSRLYDVKHQKLYRQEKRSMYKQLGLDRPSGPCSECNGCMVSKTQAQDFFSEDFYSGKEFVNPQSAKKALVRIELENLFKHYKGQFDLVIIDEAHKLNADGTSRITDIILPGRWKKMLFVTATPFALDTHDLLKLLGRLRIKEKDKEDLKVRLKEYVDLVESKWDGFRQGRFNELQELLRKYISRRIKKSKRSAFANLVSTEALKTLIQDPVHIYSTFAVESHIALLNRSGKRTHKANALETFCSSYSAIAGHKTTGKERETRYSRFLQKFIRKGKTESPKFNAALDWLVEQAGNHEKVVVFVNRRETKKRLERSLHLRLKYLADAAKKTQKSIYRHRDYLSKALALESWTDKPLYNIYSHTKAGVIAANQRRSKDYHVKNLKDLQLQLKKISADELNKAICDVNVLRGLSPAEVIGRETKEGKTISDSVTRFNLPGFPYILISGKQGQESIDLHKCCRKVLHYDLLWNPAEMEQRIGRVDRINSLASRAKKKADKEIQVYYCAIPGTYEEKMWKRVQRRQDIFRRVLGAARWVNDNDDSDENIVASKDIKMDLSPH